jgi:L-malate glycosyltransferase
MRRDILSSRNLLKRVNCMRIISLSFLDIWPAGEGKGIPSIYASQKALVDRGHEVHFICPARTGRTEISIYQGIHLYRIRLPFNVSARLFAGYIRTDRFFSHMKATLLQNLTWLFFLVYSFGWALKIARQAKPQLIYCHDLSPAFSAWLLSRVYAAKLILRMYGARDLYWRHQYFWGRLKECRDFAAIKLPADYLIITKDGTKADILARQLGVKEEKIRHWRNGVDFGFDLQDTEVRNKIRAKLGLHFDWKVIISTSRIYYFYNMDKFISQLPELFRLNPDCACIVAHSGPDVERLQEYVREQKIADRVIFTGTVEKAYLRELVNASDLYINLSRYSNCNNSLFEAMVAGKAIVATENEEIKELITSGENGSLIKEGEIDRLPEILNRLLQDEPTLRKYQVNIRKTAQEKLWTWEQRMAEEIKLLESL